MDYTPVLVVAASVAAGITSARLGYVVSRHYNKLNDATTFWLCAACATASVIAAATLCSAVTAVFGYLVGILVVLFAPPAVGIAWVLCLGGNKAFERILGNLLVRF